MRKLAYLLVVLPLLLTLVPAVVSAHTAEDPYIVPLYAGQHYLVGSVKVWNDADYLYVQYVVNDKKWRITETHLHVADSLEGIPQKNGNPPPGEFDYKSEHDCVTKVTYKIPLDCWDCNDILYIAAHTVVGHDETAWGCGPDGDGCLEFPGKNWATYLIYTLQCEQEEEWPEGGVITVAFEDLPEGAGNDWDYNDWVADIQTKATFFGTTTDRGQLVPSRVRLAPPQFCPGRKADNCFLKGQGGRGGQWHSGTVAQYTTRPWPGSPPPGEGAPHVEGPGVPHDHRRAIWRGNCALGCLRHRLPGTLHSFLTVIANAVRQSPCERSAAVSLCRIGGCFIPATRSKRRVCSSPAIGCQTSCISCNLAVQ